MHVPVSFSMGCNLEGVETIHVSSKDPEELTAKSVGTLFELAVKKYRAHFLMGFTLHFLRCFFFVVSVFINNYRKAYNFNVNKGGHYAEV